MSEVSLWNRYMKIDCKHTWNTVASSLKTKWKSDMELPKIRLCLQNVLRNGNQIPGVDIYGAPIVNKGGHVVWHKIANDSSECPVKFIERYAELVQNYPLVSDYCGLRHTTSLASIPRPLPYGELPSLDLSNQEPLTHLFLEGTSPFRIVSTGP